MFGAVGALSLWDLSIKHRWVARVTTILLLGWSVETCYAASPQFLPYFNEIAAPHADYILVLSDLDWGQDLYLLEDRLNDVPAADIYLDYFGDPAIRKHASAQWHPMSPDQRLQGWVAISEAQLQTSRDGYRWIFSYPYARIGKSIRLYHFFSSPT
jgi:hypothetical protein